MLEERDIDILGEQAKYSVISDYSKPLAHFFGSNSFPPACYEKFLHPLKSALASPQSWQNETDAIRYYRSHSAYNRLNDNNRAELVKDLTASHSSGIKLLYGRNWEISNYLGLNHVWPAIKKLHVPAVVVRGGPSMFLSDKTWKKLIRYSKHNLFLSNKDFGHLIPVKAPEICARLVLEGFNQLNQTGKGKHNHGVVADS